VVILLRSARLRSAQACGLNSSNALINNDHWKTNGIYSPQVEANMMDAMAKLARSFTLRSLLLVSMFALVCDLDDGPARCRGPAWLPA
jgi:hypothetical protein